MSGRRVLVLGGVADVLEPASRLGLEVIFLQRVQADGVPKPALYHEMYPADFDDHPGMVRLAEQINRRTPLDAVVCFGEFGLVPAALIGERLGLPGASTARTARLLRDKAAMRKTLNQAGLSPVPARLCVTAEQAADFAAEVGYPLIIKPYDGAGSVGIHRVGSAAELPATVAAAVAASSAGFLIEKFLSGVELSVEAFSFAGNHQIVALTEKQITDNYVECGHVVPATVNDTDRATIAELVGDFLKLVGVTDGATHTEVMLTDEGPFVVESHDRLGGDKIFRLVELACGADLVSWCYEWPLGLMTQPQPPEPSAVACIRYLRVPPGRVRSIRWPGAGRDAGSLDHYELEISVGDEVTALQSSLDRPGFAVTRGETRAAAIDAADRIVNSFEVEVEVEVEVGVEPVGEQRR